MKYVDDPVKKTSMSIRTSTHRRLKALAAIRDQPVSREINRLVRLGEAVEGLGVTDKETIERLLERDKEDKSRSAMVDECCCQPQNQLLST